jgi:hypothetical protein
MLSQENLIECIMQEKFNKAIETSTRFIEEGV